MEQQHLFSSTLKQIDFAAQQKKKRKILLKRDSHESAMFEKENHSNPFRWKIGKRTERWILNAKSAKR